LNYLINFCFNREALVARIAAASMGSPVGKVLSVLAGIAGDRTAELGGAGSAQGRRTAGGAIRAARARMVHPMMRPVAGVCECEGGRKCEGCREYDRCNSHDRFPWGQYTPGQSATVALVAAIRRFSCGSMITAPPKRRLASKKPPDPRADFSWSRIASAFRKRPAYASGGRRNSDLYKR
jgi:hypothetical protein